MKKILIISGGTGGHIFPAIAVADEMKQLGWEVNWLGSLYGLESQLVSDKYPLYFISVKGVRKNGWLAKLVLPWRLLRSIFSAFRLIAQLRPDLVLAMGGYVAFPGGIAAKLARVPLIIHEQNSVAGLSNRLLARVATKVLTAFPGAFPKRVAEENVGNPIRSTLMALSSAERVYNHHGPLHVLVLGGSQGAMAINSYILAVLKQLTEPHLLTLWHQTGQRDYQRVKKMYKQLAVGAKVDAFIQDIGVAYNWADIVCARSGALTVSELAAVGKGSILIPYPYAVDNHQEKNAQFLARAGAAVIFKQKTLTAEQLVTIFTELNQNRDRLKQMAQSAKKLAKHDAVQQIVMQCTKLVNRQVG